MTVHKNDVYYADLSPVIGSEQGGTRPVLVIQNDTGNKVSPTIIVAAITSRQKKLKMPTHVRITLEDGHLPKNSMAMLEQIRTIDKERLKNYVGCTNALIFQETIRKPLDQLLIGRHGIMGHQNTNICIRLHDAEIPGRTMVEFFFCHMEYC